MSIADSAAPCRAVVMDHAREEGGAVMQPFNAKTHMAVDRRSCGEIKGAEAIDMDANQVQVRRPTFDGDEISVVTLPDGIRLVRRR